MANKKVDAKIRVNNKQLKDLIKRKAQMLIKDNGDIDTDNLFNTDLLDISLFNFYDNSDYETIDLTNEVSKGADYWDNQLDEYIENLQNKLNEDISNLTKKELTDKVKSDNLEFLKIYVAGILNNSKDLASYIVRDAVAQKFTDALIEIQLQEILDKMNMLEFMNIDIQDKKYNIINYIDKDASTLKNIQTRIKDILKQAKDNGVLEIDKNQVAISIFKQDLIAKLYKDQLARVETMYLKDKATFDARHKKHEIVEKLLKELTDKYKEHNDRLKNNILNTANNSIATGYTFIDNKLQKRLEQLVANNEENPLDLALDYKNQHKGKGHKNKAIKTPVIVKIDINNNIDIEDSNITAFDKLVLNRAFSLWQVNKTHLSPELIYKDFINKDVDASQMGIDIYNQIYKSIEKWRTSTMSFIFDNKQTIKRLGLSAEEIEYLGVNRYILPLDQNFIKYKNGNIKYTYTYMRDYEPQYFILAEKIGQIKTANRKLIPTNLGYSMTTERMLMIDFLAIYIEFLKSTKGNKKYKNACYVSYDSIMEKCELLKGIDSKSQKYRQYKKNYKRYIKLVLDQYKKDKTIKDYCEFYGDKEDKSLTPTKKCKRPQGIYIDI